MLAQGTNEDNTCYIPLQSRSRGYIALTVIKSRDIQGNYHLVAITITIISHIRLRWHNCFVYHITEPEWKIAMQEE